MKVTKIPGLGRFGIFIDDVDLATISTEEWMEIGKLHLQHLVTIIRNSNCTKDRQADLIAQFGSPRYNIRSFLVNKYKVGWNRIVILALEESELIEKDDRVCIRSLANMQISTSNGKDVCRVAGGYDADGYPLGLFPSGELLWHSNESGTLTWTPGVALLGAHNVIGSSTGFVTTVDYYENVSNSFRSELDNMIVHHRFDVVKMAPGNSDYQDTIINLNMCPVNDTDVPMVIQSPGGVTGLHYSTNTAYSIKGATKQESDQIFSAINKELFVEKYIYDHWYQSNNDICVFDNSITLHRRLGDIEGRVCYRIAHDYSNLQDKVYQPYYQPKFQKTYNQQITNIVKTIGIKDFKLPKKRLVDYIPFLKNL